MDPAGDDRRGSRGARHRRAGQRRHRRGARQRGVQRDRRADPRAADDAAHRARGAAKGQPAMKSFEWTQPETIAEAVAAHGIGEPANVATAAALANAVYNAIGVRIRELPMTPRTVLAALRKGNRP